MKSLYAFLLIPLAILLMQACNVTQHYNSPDIVQEEFYHTDNIPTDSLTIADVSWDEIFTDSLLQKYINRALGNNLDIKIAIQHILRAEAYMEQGKYNYFPAVSAGLNYSLSIPSKNGQQGAQVESTGKRVFNAFELSANASWEADIWGKIKSQNKALNAIYLQSAAAHQAVKTRLIAGITSTYYQLLAVDAQIALTEETIETRKESFETTQALKDAGFGGITSTAVLQTKAQYLSAKAILIDLQTQARILENTISVLMGDEPHDIERSRLENQEITTDLKIGVPVQLLRNRPDVIAAENNYRTAYEMTNVAFTNFYPALTIGANAGLQSMELANWVNPASLFANLLGGLTQPIYNRHLIRTQYEVAQIEQDQAFYDYKAVLIKASAEVSDALYAYEASSAKIDIKREELELLQQAVEDSQELLRSGFNNFSYLEVLTAQERALGVGLELINVRVSKLNGIVELYRALGGGW